MGEIVQFGNISPPTAESKPAEEGSPHTDLLKLIGDQQDDLATIMTIVVEKGADESFAMYMSGDVDPKTVIVACEFAKSAMMDLIRGLGSVDDAS